MSNTSSRSFKWTPSGVADGGTETRGRPDIELGLCALLSVADVAPILGVSAETLRDWHAMSTETTPHGPRAVQVGNDLHYKLAEVARYMQQEPKPGE